jgi:RimJ/RimL family protein N-acetyltransferase
MGPVCNVRVVAVRAAVRLEPWEPGDLSLLQALNAREMTEHLGGPESGEKVVERHERCLRPDSRMFKIVDEGTDEAVGSVGYWERTWRGDLVYECGWGVLPRFQGRGFASAATRLAIEEARSESRHPHLHAYPSVDNDASNAICRKVGFTLIGPCEFEYPPGNFMRCNDWRFDLLAT